MIPRLSSAGGFPPVERALRDPDGLLAVGGDLRVPRLIDAYRHGIFPWYAEAFFEHVKDVAQLVPRDGGTSVLFIPGG